MMKARKAHTFSRILKNKEKIFILIKFKIRFDEIDGIKYIKKNLISKKLLHMFQDKEKLIFIGC